MKILSAAEMQVCDRVTSDKFGVDSLTLMRNASASVAAVAQRLYPGARRVLVLCGRGNNGGDGMMTACLLAERGCDVTVLLLGAPDGLKGDAAAAWRELQSANNCRLQVIESSEQLPQEQEALQTDLVIDAVVGTGFMPPLRGLPLAALEWLTRGLAPSMDESEAGEPEAAIPILAVDLPSGWRADEMRGRSTDAVFPADAVVTFTAPKPAHVFSELTRRWSQPVVVAPIGSPEAAVVSELDLCWAGSAQALYHAPRVVDANKGKFGHVLVVGGSFGWAGGKAGAPAMSAMAAMRVGAGLVTAAVPEPALAVVASYAPELMTVPLPANDAGQIAARNLTGDALDQLLKGITVLAIGPGMGQSAELRTFLEALLRRSSLPVVLDADGLNNLAADERGAGAFLRELGKERTVVLTPHPGEMARLAGLKTSEVQADRLEVARRFAAENQVTLVLKGARTLVAHPSGRVAVNTTGNPGMAKGGSGDVLTGIVAGMLAQFPDRPEQAVETAVFLHGLAADLAVAAGDEHTLLATDSLAYFSQAFRFHSRTANGYVWLQGLPRQVESARGSSEAAE